MYLALIDIVACSVIGTYFKARIATAFVGAPIIYTAMLTQARIFLALVHVHAFSIVACLIFEASFAVASIRADAIDAFSVRRARPAIFVKLTLINVLAVSVVCRYESGGTNTCITARFVFASYKRTSLDLFAF